MNTFSINTYSKEANRTLIVYGTGAVGEIVYYALRQSGIVPDYYCDHDTSQHEFMGIEVVEPDRMVRMHNADIIVAFKDYLKQAISYLREEGVEYFYTVEELVDVDFSAYNSMLSPQAQEFLIRKSNYKRLTTVSCTVDSFIVSHLEVMLTQRCTLKCRDCSALVPYFCNPIDYKAEVVLASIEKLLTAVDYISEVSLLGGEPLLYPNLLLIIEKLSTFDNIGSIVIYTNGTIVPSDVFLSNIRDKNVWVHISDYNISGVKIREIKQKMEQFNIPYYIKQYEQWQRAGNLEYRNHSKEYMINMYKKCFKARCLSLVENKLYCCARSSNAGSVGLIPDCDYVDFNENKSRLYYRKQVKDLLQKKYLQACQYCDGMVDGKQNVIAGLQLDKKGI